MKELVELLEANGFVNVKTYIQSGNVVLQSSAKPGEKIGQLIEQKFGFKPNVHLLSKADLGKAAANNPYETDQGKQVHFFFFEEEPKSVDYKFLDEFKSGAEDYKLIKKVLYLYAPDGIGRSNLAQKMGKAFPKIAVTARNLNTINKLLDMIA